MDGKTSELARRIEAKYGKTKIGETYEIDGKFYKLTDGNLDELYSRIEKFKNNINKRN
jgi:hypothetical protein